MTDSINSFLFFSVQLNVIWCADEPGSPEEVSDYDKIAKKSNGHFLQFTKIDREETLTALIDPHHVVRRPRLTRVIV